MDKLIEVIREIHQECPCLGDMNRFCADDIREQAAELYRAVVDEYEGTLT